jgi:hypothetical protein
MRRPVREQSLRPPGFAQEMLLSRQQPAFGAAGRPAIVSEMSGAMPLPVPRAM